MIFLGSSAPMNMWSYFCSITFLSYVHRLSNEHNLCSSAINIYSLIFDRRTFPVSIVFIYASCAHDIFLFLY
jgi:hypothetical protein